MSFRNSVAGVPSGGSAVLESVRIRHGQGANNTTLTVYTNTTTKNVALRYINLFNQDPTAQTVEILVADVLIHRVSALASQARDSLETFIVIAPNETVKITGGVNGQNVVVIITGEKLPPA